MDGSQASTDEAEPTALQQVLDVLPEAILTVDRRGVVNGGNGVAGAILGVRLDGTQRDADSAETFGACRTDGTAYTMDEFPLRRSLHTGETILGEQLVVRHAVTGKQTPILANSTPLRDHNGAVTGAVMIFQDISRMLEQERQRDEFFSSLSHDLKNPLASIKGTAQLLRRQVTRSGSVDPERVIAAATSIDTTTTLTVSLLEDLVDAGRLQMGRPLRLRPEPTDVVPLVWQAVERYQQVTDRHLITFTTEAPELWGNWDGPRLARVIDNLLSNAIKYSPNGGAITMKTASAMDAGTFWAVLTVQDHGIGIPPDDLPHIFERFHRAANVIGKISGTGIGLGGARQIVQLHGGTLTVDSEQGSGTVVTVRLPMPTIEADEEDESLTR